MKQIRHTYWAETFQKRDYGCDGRDIKYEWQVEKILISTPVTCMIGGEEKNRQPFYPPETIAITLAEVLKKWCPSVTVCMYRAAALAFNGVSPEAYYSEKEQQERILSRLADLDIDPDLLSKIQFVGSEEDSDTQEILQSFLRYPTSGHPLVRHLEELYIWDENFRKSVDSAVLASFRERKNAYKYTLFELAMILTKKPAIKAGDIREKKYDEIVRKYRTELWWELPEGQEKNQKPFQVIYWNRDSTQQRYHHYLHAKHQAEITRKQLTITKLRHNFRNAVVALLMWTWILSWISYSAGRIRSWQDNIYRVLIEQSHKQLELYDKYDLELRKMTDYKAYTSVLIPENKLLCQDISFTNWVWLGSDVQEIIFQRRKNLIDVCTQKLVESALAGRNIQDRDKLNMFQNMVEKIVTTYIDRRIFLSEEQFFITLASSDAYRFACEFLDTSIVASLGE